MEFDFELRAGEDLPQAAFARLRKAGPVVWCESQSAWVVSSYEAVRAVLSDVSQFTSQGTPIADLMGGQAMLVNDTPFHHTVRAVWARQVGVAAMVGRMRELDGYARAALAEVRPRLDKGESVNLLPVFRAYILDVITSSFGVPPEHSNVFNRWSELSADTPAMGIENDDTKQDTHFTVKRDVYELIDVLVADRKRRLEAGELPEDLVTLMVMAEGRDGVTSEIVRDNIFNFMLGALDTTEKWFGNCVWHLCRDPALVAELRADHALTGKFVDEVMRFDTVAQTIQRRVRDGGAELLGQTLEPGAAVLLMLGAANRDPDVFGDPDRFDLHRKAIPHLGFGFGFHHCLGVNIARAEAMAMVDALLDTVPSLRIGDIDWGQSWALWGPRALYVSLGESA